MHRERYMMSLAQWLKKYNLPNVPDAQQYIVGQPLTPEEAIAVRRIVKRGYLDSEKLNILSDTVEFCFPHNIPFLALLLNLIRDGYMRLHDDLWKDRLCETMTSDELLAVKSVLAQKQSA